MSAARKSASTSTWKEITVLSTPLAACTYDTLASQLLERPRTAPPLAVEFANTHVVTLRQVDQEFRVASDCFDIFAPDGMPLVWAMNRKAGQLRERVYGPTFMRTCLSRSPAGKRHYLLGGSEACQGLLRQKLAAANPRLEIVGGFSGRGTEETYPRVLAELNDAAPDFIWVALGTPKQQRWISRLKQDLSNGVLLSVGYAFDVNAGLKADAPPWMQRLGLTWLFRLCSEPRRLGGRYLKYNSLFLWHLWREHWRRRRPRNR